MDADERYRKEFQKCTCEPTCSFPGSLELARSFAKLDETTRVDKLRTILLYLTTPEGSPNVLLPFSERSRKRQRTQQSASTGYVLKGRTLCMHGFLAIVQVSRTTLQRHKKEIASSFSVDSYNTLHDVARKGKISVQSEVEILFLSRLSELHRYPCPIGRNSSEENPVRFLPVTMYKDNVLQMYKNEWESLLPVVMERSRNAKIPHSHLAEATFYKVWREYYSHLKLSRGDSGYCDTCYNLTRPLEKSDDSTRLHISQALARHKQDSTSEFQFYTSTTTFCLENPTSDILHVTFDFAEK